MDVDGNRILQCVSALYHCRCSRLARALILTCLLRRNHPESHSSSPRPRHGSPMSLVFPLHGPRPGGDSPHNSAEREPRYSFHVASLGACGRSLPPLAPFFFLRSSTDSTDMFPNTRVSIVPRYRLVRERDAWGAFCALLPTYGQRIRFISPLLWLCWRMSSESLRTSRNVWYFIISWNSAASRYSKQIIRHLSETEISGRIFF